MSVALTPTPAQQKWIDAFANADTPGGVLGLGTGTGKTLVSVEIAKRRGAKRVLIMAPESTFDSWASTVYWQTARRLKRCASNALAFTFTPDPSKRNDVETVKLTAAMCKSNLEACQAGEDGWYFVTRELFTVATWSKVPVKVKGEPVIDKKTKKPKMRAVRKDVWGKVRPFDLAVVDENQRFANKGNRGQQSWRNLQAGFKIASSADWFGSDLVNMHTVAVDIFGEEEIGMNQNTFIDEYMKTEYDHFSFNKKKVTGEQIPGFFAASLPLYVTAPPSVTPPEPDIRHVTLSREERALYDQLEQNYVAKIDDKILSVEVPLVLRIRLRELSLGKFRVVHTGEFNDDGIEKTTIEFDPGTKSTKLEEVRAIMAEHPHDKFLIYSHSAKWCEFAAQELGVRAYTGNQGKTERAEIKEDFIRGDLRAMVATVGAVGTGTDGLQAVCHRVIFASRDDKALDNQQAISRVARTGQTNQVEVIDLEARDTYDSGQLHSLKERVKRNDQAKGW